MHQAISRGNYGYEKKQTTSRRRDLPRHRTDKSGRNAPRQCRNQGLVPRSCKAREKTAEFRNKEFLHHGQPYPPHDATSLRRKSLENHAMDPECIRNQVQSALQDQRSCLVRSLQEPHNRQPAKIPAYFRIYSGKSGKRGNSKNEPRVSMERGQSHEAIEIRYHRRP